VTRVACIDIGTVTARLAVADVAGGRVERMLKQSTICNLGEGLEASGRISDEALARVSSCVDAYLAMARSAGAPLACCTLTSAARDAANSDELLAALGRRGVRAEVISGVTEGSLTFLGVAPDFEGRRILVADNGGGSTELAVGRMASGALALDRVRSVDVGARRATEKFGLAGDGGPTSADAVSSARAWARGLFADALEREKIASLAPELLVATGGTVTTLVAMEVGLDPYDSRYVHLHELTRDQVEGQLERLAALPASERAAVRGLQPKRAGVILGGAIAIAALMEETGFDVLTVSESDLLFGLAICAAAAAEGKEAPFGWKPALAVLK
jgi:exopolyphosphatase/guanosine-5'-triphosphate,3'-diphosphate pyrophosphatase